MEQLAFIFNADCVGQHESSLNQEHCFVLGSRLVCGTSPKLNNVTNPQGKQPQVQKTSPVDPRVHPKQRIRKDGVTHKKCIIL